MAYMPRTYAGLIKKYFYYRDDEFAEDIIERFIDYFWDNHDVLVTIINNIINNTPYIRERLYGPDINKSISMAMDLFNEEFPLYLPNDNYWEIWEENEKPEIIK